MPSWAVRNAATTWRADGFTMALPPSITVGTFLFPDYSTGQGARVTDCPPGDKLST
jgi:hypothetical protein